MFANSSTLTSRKAKATWIMPALMVVIAIVIIAIGVYMSFINNRTELVQVWARPVVAGQQITADDLTTIALPINRPETLATVSQHSNLIGLWALRSAATGELIAPAQVSTTAPTTPFYPNGVALPADMVALPFSLESVGPVNDRDTINVNFIDAAGDPKRCHSLGGSTDVPSAIRADAYGNPLPLTCRLLPQMDVLYVDQVTQIAYLAATPYQSQAVYTLAALENVQLYGERYGSTSAALPFLSPLDPVSIEADMLTGTTTDTNQLLPGFYQSKGER